MKKVVFFTVGSKEYFKYALPFWRSMTKFHSPDEIDMIYYTDISETEAKQLPKGIQVRDLRPFLKDPDFYYRQKPVLIEPLLEEYELVVGFDSDQLILGSLDYIINTKDYDVGTVLNWNRVDPQMYGLVEIGRIGILPAEYFNCGLVAVRNKKFAHQWKIACYSQQFNYCQYREQDILNILCYFGNYNVRCLDHGDGIAKYYGWHGLIAKGELNRAIVREGEIIIPKGEGDTPFPPEDIKLKCISLGGGHGAIKDNWAAYFTPEVMERVKEIIA